MGAGLGGWADMLEFGRRGGERERKRKKGEGEFMKRWFDSFDRLGGEEGEYVRCLILE